MKTHTLKFKGNHGRPKKIAEIRDLNEAGRPKSDQDILDEAFCRSMRSAPSAISKSITPVLGITTASPFLM